MQIASTETRDKSMGLIRENQRQGNGSRDWNRALCTPAEGAKFGKPESLCPLGSLFADRKAQISETEKKSYLTTEERSAVKGDDFLHSTVTSDESWFHHFDLETK